MVTDSDTQIGEICDQQSLWIFGYGSLTWKPNMSFTRREIGFIRGFKRRFWQGSTAHRGTTEKPGRVATMIPEHNAVLWGAAFEISGEESITKTLKDLNNRESVLGGYKTYYLPFIPRSNQSTTINVVVYAATRDSDMYLGPADVDKMANQIIDTSGHAGPNFEYVTKLADFTREFIPEDTDEHLFGLDGKIRELLQIQGRSLHLNGSFKCVNDNDIVDGLVKSGELSQTDLVVPSISSNQTDLVVPSISSNQTDLVVPSISSNQTNLVVPSISSNQTNLVVPSISSNQTDLVVPSISSNLTDLVVPSITSSITLNQTDLVVPSHTKSILVKT